MHAEHLKYFLALAENHSITKTSLEFYTTHQSVSKIIRQLEEEMEAQLFVRSSKGMTLTPEGEVLLPVARETVKAFQQVRLQPFMKDEYICVAGAQSPLAKRKTISIAELMQQPIAMLQTEINETHPFTQLLQRLGNVEPALQTQSRQLYGQLIASGRYVGISSRHYSDGSQLIADNDAVLIPFEEDLTLDIMLATNAQPALDDVSRAFVELARENAPETIS